MIPIGACRENLRPFLLEEFGVGAAGKSAVMDDSQNKKRWARVEEASRNIVMKALEFEGTCTGEHGIGKSRFMETEHGESLLLMRRLKALLYPENLFNPGKFFI